MVDRHVLRFEDVLWKLITLCVFCTRLSIAVEDSGSKLRIKTRDEHVNCDILVLARLITCQLVWS